MITRFFLFLYIFFDKSSARDFPHPSLVMNKKIMPEDIILGCIYALPANRDLMKAEGPKHIPIFKEGHK